MATTWQFLIDWEDNYDYADPIDDITADIKAADWNLGLSEPYQTVAPAAKLNLTVRNTDGKYNPENTGSPLYGYLVPGRRVQIAVDYGSGTTAYNFVVKGIDPDWKPAAGYTGKTQARIICEDLSGWLERDTSPTALFQSKRADQIINSILLQAPQVPVISGVWVLGKTGFSELGSTTTLAADSDFMTLDTGISTFELYGDNSQIRRTDNAASSVEERSSKRIIAEVVAAERGRFFFDRAGTGQFWNRHHMPLITSVSGTISSTGTNKPRNVNYLTDRKYFANNVEIQPHQRSTGAEITLFTLASSVSIQAGDEYQLSAPYLDANNQPTGAVNVKRGEWDGSATLALHLSAKGDRAEIKLKNNGTTTTTLTTLTLVGQPVSGKNKLTAYAEDAASILAYGKTAALKINLPALDDYEVAVSAAKYEVSRRSSPNPLVTSVTVLVDPDTTTYPLEWEIGDRITVDLPELGHAKDYIIIGESHRIEAGFFSLQTTFNLEPAETNVFWVLGTSELGDTTRILY